VPNDPLAESGADGDVSWDTNPFDEPLHVFDPIAEMPQPEFAVPSSVADQPEAAGTGAHNPLKGWTVEQFETQLKAWLAVCTSRVFGEKLNKNTIKSYSANLIKIISVPVKNLADKLSRISFMHIN
jgi:hypothetical protein